MTHRGPFQPRTFCDAVNRVANSPQRLNPTHMCLVTRAQEATGRAGREGVGRAPLASAAGHCPHRVQLARLGRANSAVTPCPPANPLQARVCKRSFIYKRCFKENFLTAEKDDASLWRKRLKM